jgi:membrane protein YdbS with pleckstrin-like domain
MKVQPLSFTVPVFVIAGIGFSAWGYYEGGMSKLIEHAVVWLVASIAAVLLRPWFRGSSQVKK